MVNDLLAAFRAAMLAVGIEITDQIIPDGELHRVHVRGDRRGSRNGWYVLYPDGVPAGVFGCWKRGIYEKWCAREPQELSPGERRRWREQVEARRQEAEEARRRRRRRAQKKAADLWNRATPADPDHPYLQEKGVGAHGIRQLRETLLISVYGPDGALRGLQRILPDGKKRFLAGTEVRGAYYPMGEPDGVVVVAEGYATGATIHEATGHAVAVAFNAGNLKAVAQALQAKLDNTRIILAADNDRRTEGNPGLTKAREAARAVGGEVVYPSFEEGEPGSDFNDLAALHGAGAVQAAIDDAAAAQRRRELKLIEGRGGEPPAEGLGSENGCDCRDSAGGRSQKDHLLQLVAEVPLFTDERDRPYAWIERDGHREVWPLEGSSFKTWLANRFYKETGKAPSASVLSDVLTVLEGRARFEGSTHELANRTARDADGRIWYDLADPCWRAIRITPEGWSSTVNPPVPVFRRFSHQQPQEVPEPGGDLRELLMPFVNLADEDGEILLLTWLVVSLVPDIPRAILVPWGPQGSAKSTLTRILRALIDPSAVPMPRFPRGEAEMAQVLDHHAAPFFDNVSGLSPRVSDTLCRAVTGDGFSKRKLYSDDEDILYRFRRPLVLNGINIPAQRPDLLDRCVLLRLEKIPEEERREERRFWAAFKSARPGIFGAMLDTLSSAMAAEPSVQLGALPRMADWTRWGYAVAEVLGLGGDGFLAAYRGNRAAADEEALTSHPVGAAVMAFMEDRSEWVGEPSALLRELEEVAKREKIDTRSKLWPAAANWVTRRLNRIASNLESSGIGYKRDRADQRLICLWRLGEEADGTSAVGADGADGLADAAGQVQLQRRLPEQEPHAKGADEGEGELSPTDSSGDASPVSTDGTDGIRPVSGFDPAEHETL